MSDSYFFCAISFLYKRYRIILLERHLISREHINSTEGSGLFVSKDETISIMVNEEDHIRLQGMLPGLQLQNVYEIVDETDNEMEEVLDFAFRPDFGFLTSSPSNVGTAVKASVMMHLPALVYTDQIAKVINAVAKLGLLAGGFFGEGSDSLGNFFQISNQSTLGETETQILLKLTRVVDQIIAFEKNTRQRLLEGHKQYIYDRIGRAYGIMKHAHYLNTREAFLRLSALRLGVDFKMFTSLDVSKINELLVLTQSGHLQKYAGKKLDSDERSLFRAEFVREKLSLK
ncbi:MAG: ATP--guanido phosphotransferase [Verrucomicrobiota bacterium]|nr:ATP--guanido phosphotransferase [Verrucomicrobiota bacterium]